MKSAESIVRKYAAALQDFNPVQMIGRVTQVVGLIIESEGPQAPVGEICSIRDKMGRELCKAEIVGFRGNKILSMVLGEMKNIAPGTEIVATGTSLRIDLSNHLLGRIVDGLGNPIDGLPIPMFEERRSVYAEPPNPFTRPRIQEPLPIGVRSIDGLLTLGRGQRVGIFAGSGVGKSTLLGMIARNTAADVNVIGLVGERGRELRDFIERDLGPEGLARSVIVVSTSDQPALMRIKAAFTSITIAEYFRDKGLNVMLMVDSVTRLAMAQREVGLAVGEPPATKGYTPSVFALMPKFMERAGTAPVGSITALYTVLVEGDDMNEPIADTARGILDGHIVLSRKLASLGHYPAVDVLESVSRTMSEVCHPHHLKSARTIIELMAAYRSAEDLISVGAYQPKSNPTIDKAIKLRDQINGFLRQDMYGFSSLQDTIAQLQQLAVTQ